MKLYCIANNEYKLKEVKEILGTYSIDIIGLPKKIDEIQSADATKIIRDKAIKAFSIIRRPLFVDHTGLYIKDFGNLPGGLTQVIWDSLEADKFCEYYGKRVDTSAKAKTIIGYCDGNNIHTFSGEVEGNIIAEPRGDRSFQWDCVFLPSGYTETFAEMGNRKNEISMRKIALEKLAHHLNKGGKY